MPEFSRTLRAQVELVGDRLVAAPFPSQGSGQLLPGVRADGLAFLPARPDPFDAGEEVEVVLSRPLRAAPGPGGRRPR
jgi:molybdopterin biosynthesis enzyme